MKSFKGEGIILKKKALLGKDLLITLFSREFGKMNLMAKGVKSIRSRRNPHLQTGNLIEFIYSKKNSFYYLQETRLISGLGKLKEHSHILNILYTGLFIVDRFLPEGQAEERVYRLTIHFFVNLDKKEDKKKELEDFLFQLMSSLGYIDQKRSYKELIRLCEEILQERMPSGIL